MLLYSITIPAHDKLLKIHCGTRKVQLRRNVSGGFSRTETGDAVHWLNINSFEFLQCKLADEAITYLILCIHLICEAQSIFQSADVAAHLFPDLFLRSIPFSGIVHYFCMMSTQGNKIKNRIKF